LQMAQRPPARPQSILWSRKVTLISSSSGPSASQWAAWLVLFRLYLRPVRWKSAA